MPSTHRPLRSPINLLYALALVLPLRCGDSGSGTSNDQQLNAAANLNNSEDALNCNDPDFSNDPASGNAGHKVTICHVPPGNPANAHTITVGAPAVPAHLAHGDHVGPCGPGEGPCGQDGGQPYTGNPPDAGNPQDGGQGGNPDGGAACLAQNTSCGAGTAPCCSPLTCVSNVCAPHLN